MQPRSLTAAYAVLLGFWFYSEQEQLSLYSQATYDFLHSWAFDVTFIGAAILAGFMVGRWWVLTSLVGSLLLLGFLQATGYISPWHDGSPPLAFSSFAQMFFFAVLLLLGVGGRYAWRHFRGDNRGVSNLR